MRHNTLNSSRAGLSLQYFIFFGIMGVHLPYFPLYCRELGFSSFEVGAVSALKTMTAILFPLGWGLLADRLNIRKPVYILCQVASTAIWAFYLIGTSYMAVMIITLVHGIFYSPIISFLEAFSMDILGPRKDGYGKIRAWGSISFISVVTGMGWLLDIAELSIIIPVVLVMTFTMSVASFSLPTTRHQKTSHFSTDARVLGSPRVIGFLIAAFLMLVSHGAYYGFFSIYLTEIGFSEGFVGIAWAVASVAEVLVMIYTTAVFRIFSIRMILIAGFIASAIRWVAVVQSGSSAAGLLATQCLHALSYGAFHIACILYIDRVTGPRAKTFGHAINNAVTYGLGIMVGILISGALYEKMGENLFYLMSGIACTGGIIMVAATTGQGPLNSDPNKKEPVGGR